MNAPTVIPSIDAIPLPAPVWLLQFFLVLTFFLHVIPMTVTLGGGFWAILAARRAREPGFGALAARLGKSLPYWTAATVSTGVAALLFLQVLYGPLFYASTVIMAWPWFSIFGVALIAYYGYYFRSYRHERSPRAAAIVGALAWGGFVLVSYIMTHEWTLLISPERHYAMYQQSAAGTAWNYAEPTLWARWLHMIVGAIAAAALWVAALGAIGLRKGEAGAREVLGFGARGFVLVNVVQIATGLWWIVKLPRGAMLQFMGRDPVATASLVLSILLTASAMWILWGARDAAAPGRKVVVGAAHVGVIFLLMVLMRDAVRRGTLGERFQTATMPTAPQWGPIVVFVLLLVAAIAIIGWMVVAMQRRRADVAAG
jgi:hypothetical protein